MLGGLWRKATKLGSRERPSSLDEDWCTGESNRYTSTGEEHPPLDPVVSKGARRSIPTEGDFEDPKADLKAYQQCQDPTLEKLRAVAESMLEDYNNVSKKRMDLVLFRFAIEHICKIARVLRQPKSHGLLVGVGGSGRQSLTRLSAYINDFDLYQVEMSKNYGDEDWYEDIKLVMRRAAEGGAPYVFLFSDTQIKKISMSL